MIVRMALAVAIILLFIGVSVIPSTGTVVEKKSTMPTNYDGNTLYVGGSGSGNYTRIQDAIDNASDGDTVFVYDDSSPYYESLIIDTSINLIGENRTTTIIDANAISTVITIHAENVTVIGFTILNGENGIWSENSKNNIIRNNKICFNTQDGIKLELSSHNHIIKNTIHSNERNGIRAYGSNNTIINNSIYSNHAGIAFLSGTDDNSISNNTIFSNRHRGISLQLGSRNIVINNIITVNMDNGIYVGYHSDNNIIKGNNISQNEQIGIEIFQARENCITNNNIMNNVDGLHIWNITHETSDGNNIYHNNFINNIQNAYDECDNTWDNGYPSGGNYWDDYNGVDNDGDGIGDTPYKIQGGDNQDRYPLMEPFVQSPEFDVSGRGGIGLKISITNVGDIVATNVEWRVSIRGGLFGLINLSENGSLNILDIGKSISLTLMPLGFGVLKISIEIDASYAEKQIFKGRFFVILFFVFPTIPTLYWFR